MRVDMVALRANLRANSFSVAEALLGPAKDTMSTKREKRWGQKGSLMLTVDGPNRGVWIDFEDGNTGGDLLDLIRRECRCEFPAAVDWACRQLGSTSASSASQPSRPPDRTGQIASRVADDRGRTPVQRVAKAQAIVAAGLPLADRDLATYYLKQERGISCPPAGWPSALSFHQGHRALLFAATTADGVVQAVQRIHLSEDGQKITFEEARRRGIPAPKMTSGVLAGAVVRLQGDPAWPLLLAEGPETGLAAHAATGWETWVALGKIGPMTPPTGRLVVVLADDDPEIGGGRPGFANGTLCKVLTRWRHAGITVAVVWPWAERKYDRSDMADVSCAKGAQAVRDRILDVVRNCRTPIDGAATAG